MKIQAVLQGGAEEERTKGRALVKMEHGSIVVVVIGPPIGKRSFPTPKFLPVSQEDGISIQVYSSVAMSDDEPRHVRQYHREPVISRFRFRTKAVNHITNPR